VPRGKTTAYELGARTNDVLPKHLPGQTRREHRSLHNRHVVQDSNSEPR
jgi:hypothetical protein